MPQAPYIFPVNADVTDLEYSCMALGNLRGVKIAQYNVRGLIRKIDEIGILLNRSKIDMLFLTETFLTPNITDGELDIAGYECIRWDRNTNSNKIKGGGVNSRICNQG